MRRQKTPCFIFIIFAFFIMAGCEKNGTNCLTNAGEVVFEQRTVGDFDSINVGDYVNLFITQDTANAVSIESGRNIIDGISTDVTDRTLMIRNLNQCNWLRSYNIPVNVHIRVNHLAKIFYNSSGNITSVNQIVADKFSLVVWGGAGIIDLNLRAEEGSIALVMGTADIRLHGHCSINSVVSGDFGLYDASDMTTGYTFIKNEGSNDCYVKASQFLQATIGSIGNIYYYGRPDTLVVYQHGTGQVIPL